MTAQRRKSTLRLAGVFLLWLLIGYVCGGIPYHLIMSSGVSLSTEGVLLLAGLVFPPVLAFMFAYRVKRRQAASLGQAVLAAVLGLAAIRALYIVVAFVGGPFYWDTVLWELSNAATPIVLVAASSAFGALWGSPCRRRQAWTVTVALTVVVAVAWATPYLLPRTVTLEIRIPGLQRAVVAEIASKHDRPNDDIVLLTGTYVNGPGPFPFARFWRYRLYEKLILAQTVYTEDYASQVPPLEAPPREEERLADLPKIRADEGYREAAEDLLARLRERFPEMDFHLDWTPVRLEVIMANFDTGEPPTTPAELPAPGVSSTLQDVIRTCLATDAPPTEELWTTFLSGDGSGQERGAWKAYQRLLGADKEDAQR